MNALNPNTASFAFLGARMGLMRICCVLVVLPALQRVCHATVEEDEALFKAKETTTFSTVNHAKADGIKLSIRCPKTWKALEGNRPHIVQKLISENGTGSASIQIYVRDLGGDARNVTKQEKKEAFENDEMVKTLSAPGSEIHKHQCVTIEGEPCLLLNATTKLDRLTQHFLSYELNLLMLLRGKLVTISCGIAGTEDEDAQLRAKFNATTPLFMAILNSLVLLDRYE